MTRFGLAAGMALGLLLETAGASPLILEVDPDTGRGERLQVEPTRPLGVGRVRPRLLLDLDGDRDLTPGRDAEVVFGTRSIEPEDPWTRLRGYDADRDGRVDPEDPAFPRLVLWLDLDRDMVLGSGEMRSADELGVAAVVLPEEGDDDGRIVTETGAEHRAGLRTY